MLYTQWASLMFYFTAYLTLWNPLTGLGITTHYFLKRRPLAIGIASSGSALGTQKQTIPIKFLKRASDIRAPAGAVVHPIVLNQFFDGRIGFHKGVWISGGINLALFIIAISVMRTRLPPKPVQHFPVISWMKEPAYLSMFLGSDHRSIQNWSRFWLIDLLRSWFVFFGLFYPIFYIQLSAIKHGINHTFAFYSVRSSLFIDHYFTHQVHFTTALNT